MQKRIYIEAIAKHLPPSASQLRLLDIGAETGDILIGIRPDLLILPHSVRAEDWSVEQDSVDAVVGYDLLLSDTLLQRTLATMRPGGRLILVNPAGEVDAAIGERLASYGFVRILVESAAEGQGVLIRGEKPHITADTHARIDGVAQRDNDSITLADYRGRFLYLLVQQFPNKPVWRLAPDEKVSWHALTVDQGQGATMLAFSSLPRAVAFMQQAVLENLVSGINKVPKFTRETVVSWRKQILINPELLLIRNFSLSTYPVDPAMAEAPDE